MKIRDRRYEVFVDDWLPVLEYYYKVVPHTSCAFKITTKEYGTYFYYPKSDKLLIPSDNEWVDNGLDFIREELIP